MESLSFIGLVSNIKEADSIKPILIIGWKNAQKDPDYTSSLHKQLTKTKFWTFSRTERRSDLEQDVEAFYSFCIDECKKQIKYYYINPFSISITKTKHLCEILFTQTNTIYITNNMMYVLYNNSVLGISFRVLNYIGISVKKLYSRLYKNKQNTIIKDDNKQVIELKSYLNSEDLYLIPYLIS